MKLKAWVLALSLLVGLPLFGQKITSAIRGTVTDQTGAVLSGAQVTVVNTATADTRTAVSGSEGEFAVTDLAPGIYEIRVKHANFKEAVSKGNELHVSTDLAVTITMQVGSAGEQVTVEANAIQVETTTGAVGNVVDSKQVTELPLNGRSFTQLTQLMPGVSPASNFDAKNKGLMTGVDFSVNGNNTTGNLFLVDGVNNNDIGSNRTILVYPSIDAIQEFKILRNSYGPEYGQAMGAIINIVTKGGTNQFHGGGFYFGRNDKLAATDFYNLQTGQAKNILRRNDWGYNIGGPIVKDKLFFFWSEEWNHEKRGALRQAVVPTTAERAGNFAADVAGDSCHPAPTNGMTTIPAGQLSLSGAAYVAMFPDPNLAVPVSGCNNWAQSLVSPIIWREENIRVDYKLGKTWSVMARYTHDAWDQATPSTLNFWGDDNLPSIEEGWQQQAQQATIKLTKLFGSTAVNDFQFSFGGNHINGTVGGTGGTITAGGPMAGSHLSAQALNLAILTNQGTSGLNTFFPVSNKLVGNKIGYPGFWGGSCPAPCPGTTQNLWNQGPWKNNEQLYIVKDDFSKVMGAHTFKLGFIGTLNQKNEQTGNESTENAFYWGASSNNVGNGVFDLLWNQVQWGFGESQSNPVSKIRWRDVEFYYGDNWKIRRNLTVEYGVRWSFLRPPFSATDQIGNFVPALYNPALGSDSCNGIEVTKIAFCRGQNLSGLTFLGGTVSPNRSMKAADNNSIAPRLGIAWSPGDSGKTFVRAGLGQFFQRERLNNTLNLSLVPPFNLSVGGSRTFDTPPTPGSLTASGAPNFGQATDSNIPDTWQWNFTVERELARDTKLEVAYVGNKALHIMRHNDVNEVPLANRYHFATNNTNSDRPFGVGSWGAIPVAYWTAQANYHSLQALFRTRMKGLDAQFAYTYSKSLSDSDPTISGNANQVSLELDPAQPHLNYGTTNINRPHTFVGSIVYNVPTFAGHSALARNLAGGWELAAIPSYSTGTSMSVFTSNNLDNSGPVVSSGGVSGTGTPQTNVRPMRVAGQGCYATGRTAATRNTWLNPNAWTMVGFPVGGFGNDGIGDCLTPGIANTDFSAYKNFKVTERVTVQFRMEFYNVFNKVQFLGNSAGGSFVGNQISNGNHVTNADPTHVSSFTPNSGFGIDTKDKGPREIQYALKITF